MLHSSIITSIDVVLELHLLWSFKLRAQDAECKVAQSLHALQFD